MTLTFDRRLVGPAMLMALLPGVATGQVPPERDSLRLRFVETELRAVVQALGQYLPKPLLLSNLPAVRVTLDHPASVPVAGVPGILRGLAESFQQELVEESDYFLLRPRIAVVTAPGLPGAAALTAPIRLFTLRLKHARAADVAATVNLLFGRGGDFGGRTGLATGTLSEELRQTTGYPAQVMALQAQAQGGESGNRESRLSGALAIVPDELTNTLLIRANEQDHEVLREVVAQLDIRPLQVLIEVLIVEARKDRGWSLGTAFQAQRASDGEASGVELSPLAPGDLVVHLMRSARTEVSAMLSAAQARGDVRIVSRPVLLASNNVEATFLVGNQRPFVQVSRSLPTDTPSRDQVVQYKDVGTKLTVRPTINQDGYVSLLVQQEISAATSESQFDAPIISTREARTQVLVRDQQTIMLGGLSDDQRESRQSGIPVLSALPVIGGLFGGARRQRSSTELYLFLTPRIIATDAVADSLTAARLRTMEVPDGVL